MDKSDKGKVKANASVPDIVFYQLTMDKEERVIGFVENDSEEHFGKLARKGGEILLPGVFAQKATRLPEDLTKVADGHQRKGKVQVRVDIPTSDTELKTLLIYGGSSGELRCIGKDNGKKAVEEKKSFGSESAEDSIRGETSELILQTEQLTDVTADNSAGKPPEEGDEKQR